jgi:hypothetical protein
VPQNFIAGSNQHPSVMHACLILKDILFEQDLDSQRRVLENQEQGAEK